MIKIKYFWWMQAVKIEKIALAKNEQLTVFKYIIKNVKTARCGTAPPLTIFLLVMNKFGGI